MNVGGGKFSKNLINGGVQISGGGGGKLGNLYLKIKGIRLSSLCPYASLFIRFLRQYNSGTLKLVKIPLVDSILLNIL